MPIEVTVRHIKVSDDAKSYIKESAQKILDEFRTLENVHVILDGRSYRMMAEIIVQGKRVVHPYWG